MMFERDRYAACPTSVGMHAFLYVALVPRWRLFDADVVAAFLHAVTSSSEKVTILNQLGIAAVGSVWLLHKALYDLLEPPRW